MRKDFKLGFIRKSKPSKKGKGNIMKNVRNLLPVLITILMFAFVTMQPTLIYARDPGQSAGEYKNELQKQYQATHGSGDFDPNDYKPGNPGNVVGGSKLLGKINIVLGWVNNIAVMASVLVLSIIGIKYMVGSVEEKAEYKKNMKPYLVGCVLAFGITTILKIISSIAQTLN